MQGEHSFLPVKRRSSERLIYKHTHRHRPIHVHQLQLHSVAQWHSGQRSWNSSSVTPVGFPGRATIPLGSNLGQVFYSHSLRSFSAPRKWGRKREFSAPNWLWSLSDIAISSITFGVQNVHLWPAQDNLICPWKLKLSDQMRGHA